MAKVFEGHLNAKDIAIAVVISRFNKSISQQLLEGAKDAFYQHQGDENNLDIYWVPGAFEIPGVAMQLANSGKYQAVVCLGAVIRGETPHFDYICQAVTRGIAQVSLETKIPATFGIITADATEQAIERSGVKSGNKGWQATISAIELVNLRKHLPNASA